MAYKYKTARLFVFKEEFLYKPIRKESIFISNVFFNIVTSELKTLVHSNFETVN